MSILVQLFAISFSISRSIRFFVPFLLLKTVEPLSKFLCSFCSVIDQDLIHFHNIFNLKTSILNSRPTTSIPSSSPPSPSTTSSGTPWTNSSGGKVTRRKRTTRRAASRAWCPRSVQESMVARWL